MVKNHFCVSPDEISHPLLMRAFILCLDTSWFDFTSALEFECDDKFCSVYGDKLFMIYVALSLVRAIFLYLLLLFH